MPLPRPVKFPAITARSVPQQHSAPAPVGALGERALIKQVHRASRAGSQGTPGLLRLGIGDDCAVLGPRPGEELVVTTDLFLEQVHFRRDWHQPEVAGHRCLARGLSDIAAMGAVPAAVFLSWALPSELAGAWATRFLDGLLRLARRHQVPLAGGDTAQAPLLPLPGRDKRRARQTADAAHPRPRAIQALFAADIVVLGTVPRGHALLRSGARAGDELYVTGPLGGAAAELASLEQSPQGYAHLVRARAKHPHLFPQPQLEVGRTLRGLASSAIDLSDGISTDLAHLCEQSGVAAEIDAALLPVHAKASLDQALHGGEDYELLFTVPAGRRMPKQLAGTPIQRIGSMVKAGRGRPRVTLIGVDGRRASLASQGWEHFRHTPQ